LNENVVGIMGNYYFLCIFGTQMYLATYTSDFPDIGMVPDPNEGEQPNIDTKEIRDKAGECNPLH